MTKKKAPVAPKAPTPEVVEPTPEVVEPTPEVVATVVKDTDKVTVKNAKGKEFKVTGRYYNLNSHKLTIVK